MTFDSNTLKWTPLSDKARAIAREWTDQKFMNDAYRNFAQTLCNNMGILKMKQEEKHRHDNQTGNLQQSET